MQISPGPSTDLIQVLTAYFQAPSQAAPKPPAKTEKVPEPETELSIDRNAQRGTYLDITV